MNDVRCEPTRRIAGEIALGVASGDERAMALQHATGCAECRLLLLDLAQVADEILLIAPSHEPPPGFETRVLDGLASEGSVTRPSRWKRTIFAVAAALVALAVGAAGTLYLTRDERRVGSYYREALGEINGDYFSITPLVDMADRRVGASFAYQGDPSWIFCTIADASIPSGSYEAMLVTEAGELVEFGAFEISETRRTWGKELPVEVRDLAAVRLIGTDGRAVLEARFGG